MSGPVRVLVVDDEPMTADSLGWLMEAGGCEARVCHSGAEALAEAADFRPHVCFVDLLMPGVNGLDVAAGLRALPHPPRLVTCLTGASDEAIAELVRAAGFDLHFVKPTDPRDLVLVARSVGPDEDAA
jgi:CheY-like chemotaxis protein